MALFALLPTLLRKGLGFWTALTVSSAATAVLYAMMIWAIRRYSAAG
jgi:hypothetical protein